MNAKQYLSQLRGLEAIIAARKTEAAKLRQERTYLQGVSYDKDRVQTSGNHNAQFEKLADIIADTERETVRLAQKRHLIISQIEHLGNAQYVELLQLRYLEYQKFEAIACTMGLSYVRVTHLHGEALLAFQKKYLT